MTESIKTAARSIATVMANMGKALSGKTNALVGIVALNPSNIVLTGERKVAKGVAKGSGQEGWTFSATIGGTSYQVGCDCISRALLDNGLTLESLQLADNYNPSPAMLTKLENGWKRQVIRKAKRDAEKVAETPAPPVTETPVESKPKKK